MGAHINKRKPTQRTPDAQRVLDSIRRIVQALRIASRAAEQRFGLSAAQLFVLQKLDEADATSVNDLAGRTLTDQSSVSVVVQRLADRKLVQRLPSRADGRRIVLSLTPAGRKLVQTSPEAPQERLIGAVHRLPVLRRRELAQTLEQIADEATGIKPPSAPLFFEETSKTLRTTRRTRHVPQRR